MTRSSRDLMKYATELNPPRPMMLLINKADFLTDYQRLKINILSSFFYHLIYRRRIWAEHLDAAGIKFAFYSAQNEQIK
jgi:hypothetical protein